MLTPDENLEYRSGVNDPMWDAELCECQNNGDLCTYCQRFEEMDLEDFLEDKR